MPEVSLDTKNQCTLDDPTDGANLPSAVPSVRTPNEVPTAAPVPLCLAHEPGSGGATSDCTEELVRNFGGGDGAGPLTPTPLGERRSCGLEVFSTLSNCGKVAAEALESLVAKQNEVNAFDALNCAGSLAALSKCEFSD